MKSKLQLIAGATAVATLAAGFSMTAPVAAHAFAFKECKSFTLSGKGRRAVLKIAAQNSARRAWRGVVSTRLNHTYSYWVRAEAKRYDCSKSRRRWTCWAIAKPCSGNP
jgi:hypothetical protein